MDASGGGVEASGEVPGDVPAATVAQQAVAEVRDRPQARLDLLRSSYTPLAGAPPLHLRYRRAALAFMGWQVQRGLLNPLDHARPGSPWWRAVNERLLRDTCEARSRLLGHPGPASSPSVEPSVRFARQPTSRSWYLAHNVTIVTAFLEHRDMAERENRIERFFINLVLVRLLYAHALVAAPRLALAWLSPAAPWLGDPRRAMTGIFLSVSRVLPDRYPLEGELDDYVAAEHTVGRLLDLGVIVPRLPELYRWSADELQIPELADLIGDGTPTYAWDPKDREPWAPPPTRLVRAVRGALRHRREGRPEAWRRRRMVGRPSAQGTVSLPAVRSRLALPFAVLLAAVLTSVPAAMAGTAGGEEVAAAVVLPAEASAFTTTVPHRVLDTRIGLGAVAGPVAAGGTLVLGRSALGVPADASAVAVNITLTEATGAGYATLWPRGAPRPLASNVNVGGAGDTVANGAVVPISDVGLAIYVSAATQVVLDVSGWTTLASGPVAGGRIMSIPQVRLLDTRLDPGGDAGRVDTTPRLLLVAPAGVPSDAAAVIANVTVTENAEAGYVAVWAAGQPQPPTSSVNTSARGQTVANLVVAPLGPGAGLLLAASSPTHVLVDVVGYVTGPSAPTDVAGLYVPIAPARVVDSRTGFLVGGARGPLPGGHRFDVAVGGRAGVPTEGVAAVLMNLTAIDAGGAGFLASYPAGRMWPGTSSLNLDQPRQTRANLVLAGLGHAGRTSLYGSTWLDVAADVAGYVIGEPAPGEAGEPADPPPSGWWACSSGEAPAPAPPTLVVPAGASDAHVIAERPGGRLATYIVPGTAASASTTAQIMIRDAGLDPQQRDERLFGIGVGTRVSTTVIGMVGPAGPVTQVVYDSFVCGIPPMTE